MKARVGATLLNVQVGACGGESENTHADVNEGKDGAFTAENQQSGFAMNTDVCISFWDGCKHVRSEFSK